MQSLSLISSAAVTTCYKFKVKIKTMVKDWETSYTYRLHQILSLIPTIIINLLLKT